MVYGLPHRLSFGVGDDETSCDSLLQVYKLTAVDKMLAMVSVKAGIEFTTI